jgi:hypothetical protein
MDLSPDYEIKVRAQISHPSVFYPARNYIYAQAEPCPLVRYLALGLYVGLSRLFDSPRWRVGFLSARYDQKKPKRTM